MLTTTASAEHPVLSAAQLPATPAEGQSKPAISSEWLRSVDEVKKVIADNPSMLCKYSPLAIETEVFKHDSHFGKSYKLVSAMRFIPNEELEKFNEAGVSKPRFIQKALSSLALYERLQGPLHIFLESVTNTHGYDVGFNLHADHKGKIIQDYTHHSDIDRAVKFVEEFFEGAPRKSALLVKLLRHQIRDHNENIIAFKRLKPEGVSGIEEVFSLSHEQTALLPVHFENGFTVGQGKFEQWHSRMHEHRICHSVREFRHLLNTFHFCTDFRNFEAEGRHKNLHR